MHIALTFTSGTSQKEGRSCGQWRELRALVRGPLESYMRKNRRAARAPPGPQHINFWGCERATPARSASGKGLPSPDGLGSFRGARRSTRARDQAWGPTERRRTPERTIRPVRLRHPTAHVGVCLWPARCHRIAAASPLTCVGHRIRSL